jgi:hypothetical protein
VRRDALQQQTAFLQGFTDQGKVQHLQVAQPAVDELGGPGGRAGRPVPGLHNAHVEAAGDGVQRGAGADHSPANDQYVQLPVVVLRGPQGGQGLLTAFRTHGSGTHTQSALQVSADHSLDMYGERTTSHRWNSFRSE